MTAVDPTADERERMADEISDIQIGSGYYSTTIGITAALIAADALRAAGFGDVAAERARLKSAEQALDLAGMQALMQAERVAALQARIDAALNVSNLAFPVLDGDTAVAMVAALTVDQPAPTPEPKPERATVTFMGQTEERVCSNPEPHDAHTWAIGARLRWVCPGSMQPTPEPPHLDPEVRGQR